MTCHIAPSYDSVRMCVCSCILVAGPLCVCLLILVIYMQWPQKKLHTVVPHLKMSKYHYIKYLNRCHLFKDMQQKQNILTFFTLSVLIKFLCISVWLTVHTVYHNSLDLICVSCKAFSFSRIAALVAMTLVWNRCARFNAALGRFLHSHIDNNTTTLHLTCLRFMWCVNTKKNLGYVYNAGEFCPNVTIIWFSYDSLNSTNPIFS